MKWEIRGQKDQVMYLTLSGVKHRIPFDENGVYITENEEIAFWFANMTGEYSNRVKEIETEERGE